MIAVCFGPAPNAKIQEASPGAYQTSCTRFYSVKSHSGDASNKLRNKGTTTHLLNEIFCRLPNQNSSVSRCDESKEREKRGEGLIRERVENNRGEQRRLPWWGKSLRHSKTACIIHMPWHTGGFPLSGSDT
jgi:hypothetical protein